MMVPMDSSLSQFSKPWDPPSVEDLAIIETQLERPPRGVLGVAYRCPSGHPGVIVTAPRLPNGSPFPTFYYLTCPQAVAACSRLEAAGIMAEWTQELADDPKLAAEYRSAHQAYLTDREALEVVPELSGVSAGGMPDRVKCLHALLGHALGAGRGVNPIGDRVLDMIGDFCPVEEN
jgi:hypothetical protein